MCIYGIILTPKKGHKCVYVAAFWSQKTPKCISRRPNSWLCFRVQKSAILYTQIQMGVSQRVFIPSRASKYMLESKRKSLRKWKKFEVGQLHFEVLATSKNTKYIYFIYTLWGAIVGSEVAQLQIFFHFLKLLRLLSNIYFEAREGIKTRWDTPIWIWVPRIANFCTRKRSQLLGLRDIYGSILTKNRRKCVYLAAFWPQKKMCIYGTILISKKNPKCVYVASFWHLKPPNFFACGGLCKKSSILSKLFR